MSLQNDLNSIKDLNIVIDKESLNSSTEKVNIYYNDVYEYYRKNGLTLNKSKIKKDFRNDSYSDEFIKICLTTDFYKTNFNRVNFQEHKIRFNHFLASLEAERVEKKEAKKIKK